MAARFLKSGWKTKLIVFSLLALLLISAWYSLLLRENNRDIHQYEVIRLEQSLELAIGWLERNKGQLGDNSVLWWMIKESGRLTGRIQLTEMSKHYETEALDANPEDGWVMMFFRPHYLRQPINPEALIPLHDYQKLFVYGLSCDADLGQLDVIRDQLDPSFCGNHFFYPRCVTHQLMGLRFMQVTECGNGKKINSLVNQLQDTLVLELTWDPRVGDAYIQRVVMLVESGGATLVKPIWIQRVLDAQNADGGWDDIDPIIRLPGNSVLGFTSKLPTIAEIDSDFHATAQGVWLISLLLSSNLES
jgi:hypothetical protein